MIKIKINYTLRLSARIRLVTECHQANAAERASRGWWCGTLTVAVVQSLSSHVVLSFNSKRLHWSIYSIGAQALLRRKCTARDFCSCHGSCPADFPSILVRCHGSYSPLVPSARLSLPPHPAGAWHQTATARGNRSMLKQQPRALTLQWL